ncbi:hypothetical protein HNO89_001595 [Sporosarcina luteola]|nr:hypothetical protein [Sporosarcina luteola]
MIQDFSLILYTMNISEGYWRKQFRTVNFLWVLWYTD